MDSNLHPYPLSIINNLICGFVTDAAIEYQCVFLSYSEYFSKHPHIAPFVYSFNLELKDKNAKPKKYDSRIADTVVTIVGDFLSSQINAVVYVCDNSDEKEAIRARKFKSWFNFEEHESHEIIKVSTDFDAGGITLYTALLVHKKNKLKKDFVNAYLELTDVNTYK